MAFCPVFLENVEGRFGEILYVNNTFTIRNSALKSYHIFAGKTRVASRLVMLGKDESGKETEKENGTYYFHGDHLGSSSVITNKSGGFHEHLEYFPYGETWVHEKVSEDIESMPFRFTGKEQDPETDLYYFGARYYDAVVSRWVSADPILGKYLPTGDEKKDKNLPGLGGVFNPVNLNLYHYAGNNPVKFVDPDGKRIATWTEEMAPINLLKSQKIARNKSMYKPGAGGPFNIPAPWKTWCNQAVFDVAEKTGLNINLLVNNKGRYATNANQSVDIMRANAKKGLLSIVGGKTAQNLADRGFTVIAGWKNKSGGSGHVATLLPSYTKYDPEVGPMVSNVGRKNKIQPVIEAFGKSKMKDVQYFYNPKQKFKQY